MVHAFDNGFGDRDEARGGKRRRANKASASELLARQPPFDLEAEMGVLGSILLLPEVCDDIASLLRGDDFYDDANRILYTHIREMYDSGTKIDHTLLISRLKTVGDLEKIGGVAYLGKLSIAVPNAAHAVYYAQIVSEKATMRKLIEASTEILRDAYDQNGEARELVSQAEQKVFAIMDGRSAQHAASIKDILHQSMDRMEARLAGTHVDGGCETGFADFDTMTGGLHNGELVILAARPSMGKTALAMNISENVALQNQ